MMWAELALPAATLLIVVVAVRTPMAAPSPPQSAVIPSQTAKVAVLADAAATELAGIAALVARADAAIDTVASPESEVHHRGSIAQAATRIAAFEGRFGIEPATQPAWADVRRAAHEHVARCCQPDPAPLTQVEDSRRMVLTAMLASWAGDDALADRLMSGIDPARFGGDGCSTCWSIGYSEWRQDVASLREARGDHAGALRAQVEAVVFADPAFEPVQDVLYARLGSLLVANGQADEGRSVLAWVASEFSDSAEAVGDDIARRALAKPDAGTAHAAKPSSVWVDVGEVKPWLVLQLGVVDGGEPHVLAISQAGQGPREVPVILQPGDAGFDAAVAKIGARRLLDRIQKDAGSRR